MECVSRMLVGTGLACKRKLEGITSRKWIDWGIVLLATAVFVGTLHGEVSAQCGGPSGSCTEASFEDDLIRNSVGNLFELIEGAFGALIMVVAGLGAIVAAAMGAYRAAVGMLVVAVGAFILRALVSLFFGADYIGYKVD